MASNVPDEPETQEEMSIQLKMENQRQKLIEIVEPKFGLLATLRNCRAINSNEQEEIDVEKTTLRKNEKLLEIIVKKGKHRELIEALRISGQIHVVNWINGNGDHKVEFGCDWPLTEREVNILECNYEQLSELLDVKEDLFGKLYSRNVISSRQKEFILSKQTSFEANEAFLNILMRSSLRSYFSTIDCLRDSNQGHVAEVLEKGGAVVPVHATLEGENVDAIEKELVNKMVKLHREHNASLEDSDINRLITSFRLSVIATKQGKSVVLYVCCQEIEEFHHLCTIVDNLEMTKLLDQLFNLLLRNLRTKVLLVTIAESDRKKAENLFQREAIRDKKLDEHFRELQLHSQLKYESMKVTSAEYLLPEKEGKEELLEMPWLTWKWEDRVLAVCHSGEDSDEEAMEMEEPKKKKEEPTHPSTSQSMEVTFTTGEQKTHDTELVSQTSEDAKKFQEGGAQASTDQDIISAIIRNNFEFFQEQINPSAIASKLSRLGILKDDDRRYIMSLPSTSDKNYEILNVIRESSVKNYYKFVECLKDMGQNVAANVAEKGGVAVKVNVFFEPIENLTEIENEIVVKLKQLHDRSSPRSDDLWRLLSQMKVGRMEILSARRDNGIVTWLWCHSSDAVAKLEHLSKTDKLGNLFCALFRLLVPTVPKIRDVHLDNTDVDFVNRRLCNWSIKTSATMSGLKISGVAILDEKIIMTFQNRRALLFFSCDEKGNTVPDREEPLKDIKTPMHMTASPKNRCLYIADRSNNAVWKVHIGLQGDTVDKKVEPWLGLSADQINSLSIGRNDDVIILRQTKPRSRLEIYNTESKAEKPEKQLELPAQIVIPHHAAEALNGDFVISSDSGIYRITSDGQWVARLDIGYRIRPIATLSKVENSALASLSEGFQYLKYLDHFALDDKDQVYVCDGDRFIVFLDSELNMEKVVEVKKLVNPYRIHYVKDKNELLVVHSGQNSFSVLNSK